MKTIKVGSDFSGVGAFDFAINRVAEEKGFKVENVFACDWDKYARKSYLANHKEPGYYPHDVYERDVPEECLDIYMTSPPCQGFSLAGSRKTKEDDKRNILFYNSHEFIKKNNPRYFVFENVRGLMSHENGSTFREWINLLSGKSINGLPVLFPHDESVPYHIYYAVLNTKKIANIPQNRERVFIIGIRNDDDNYFRFPKEQPLSIKLKEVLQENVNEKYFLSKERIDYLRRHNVNKNILKNDIPDISRTCIAGYYKSPNDCTYIKVHSANEKGFEVATNGDSINFSHPKSKTKRGRVGHQVSQTIDTKCTLGVMKENKVRRLTPRECFRLQGFKDDFQFVVSDAQLYKQAGNSITIDVLQKILNNLTF